MQMYDVFLNVALSAGMERCSFCSICTKIEHFFTENDYLCQQKGLIMNSQPQLMDHSQMQHIKPAAPPPKTG